MQTIYINKAAKHDFEILEKLEAGIALEGWEVKSVKNNQVSLKGGYVREKDGELFLRNAKISKWRYSVDPTKEDEYRERKLLLKSRQISSLSAKVKEKGVTIIPLDIYVNNTGLIKLTIGVGKGRKKYDKRRKLKEKDLKRNIDLDKKQFRL